jgi:hypothetical protein
MRHLKRMKTVLIIIVVLLLLAGGLVWYLHSTTPAESARVRFPLSATQRSLIAAVPENADAFALIPTAAALHAKLLANPVTREPLRQWSETVNIPRPWMLGAADVVVWKSGKATQYAVTLDPFRALLARFYLRIYGGVGAQTFIINPPGGTIPARMSTIERLAAGLPPADVLVFQLDRSRGAFPPIGRPALTAVDVTPREIVLVSRATYPGPAAPVLNGKLANKALMSATFGDPPRFLSDLDRLTGSSVSALLGEGGSIVLYDIDTGTLLPRPKGIITTPANDKKRQALSRIRDVADAFGEVREKGGDIVIALDRTSMSTFASEEFSAAPWPATEWAFRGDARRMVPLVEKLADNTGLRLAAPRTYRAARDLRRWVRSLEAAGTIEAAHSRPGAVEELRVRITSK